MRRLLIPSAALLMLTCVASANASELMVKKAKTGADVGNRIGTIKADLAVGKKAGRSFSNC